MYIIYVLHLIEYHLQAAWDFKPTDLFVITLTVPLSVSLQYLFTLETIWRAHHLWLSSRKMVLTLVFPSGSSDSRESGASKCWISRSTAKLPIDQKFFSQPFWLPSWLVLFALVSLCFVHKQQSNWRWHQTNCILAVSSVFVTEGTSGMQPPNEHQVHAFSSQWDNSTDRRISSQWSCSFIFPHFQTKNIQQLTYNLQPITYSQTSSNSMTIKRNCSLQNPNDFVESPPRPLPLLSPPKPCSPGISVSPRGTWPRGFLGLPEKESSGFTTKEWKFYSNYTSHDIIHDINCRICLYIQYIIFIYLNNVSLGSFENVTCHMSLPNQIKMAPFGPHLRYHRSMHPVWDWVSWSSPLAISPPTWVVLCNVSLPEMTVWQPTKISLPRTKGLKGGESWDKNRIHCNDGCCIMQRAYWSPYGGTLSANIAPGWWSNE